MSIMPLPELPPQSELPSSSALPSQPEGFRLSALEAYSGEPGALPGVSFWPRVWARVIDLIVHYAITFCSGIFFGLLVGIAAGLQHRPASLAHRHPSGVALFIMGLLGSIVFEAICEGVHGSTPGKRLLGMTAVQEDGSPCRLGPAFIRSFAYLIDGLFFGLIGYFNMQKTPQQQRHGDEWAHTIVCRRSVVAPQNLRGGGRFVLAFCLAVMVDSALVITGFLSWVVA